MENIDSLKEIANALTEQGSVLIFAHKNPDGDAIGSSICAGLALKSLGKHVKYALGKDSAELYKIFEEGEHFGEPIEGAFDAALIVDCSTDDFIDNEPLLKLCAKRIVIDHHKSNQGYGDIAYCDSDAAATGEILYALLQIMGIPLTRQIANALFLSLSGDTGYFKYSNTTAKTHEIMAELYQYSDDFTAIAEYADSYSLEKLRLTQAAIDSLEFHYAGRLGILSLTKANKLLEESVTDGLIDIVRNVKGCLIAVFIRQIADDGYKVSIRSVIEGLDLSEIACSFGGGGHKRAAGFNIKAATLQEAKEAIVLSLKNVWTD